MTSLRTVPLVPLRDGVVFPHTEAVLTFGRPKSNAGVEAAFRTDMLIVFVTQKNSQANEPGMNDIYGVGTLCSIERILKTDGEINALVKGTSRVKINQLTAQEPFLLAQVEELLETVEESDEMTALVKHVSNNFKTAVNIGKSVDFLMFMRVMGGVSASELADQVATNLDVDTPKKQLLLEETNVKKRLQAVSDHLSQELKILEIERSISTKTQRKFDKSMRETVLRERMRTIQKELGEDDEDKDIKEYKQKINTAGMSEEVKKRALKEVERLSEMHAYNPEAGYLRTYLDWLCELPWGVSTPNQVTIKAAEKILETDHYGLKEVKERILEYLAVMQLKRKALAKGQSASGRGGGPTILCFVGPPGVGKTSIGRSIARALKRKFVKVSLGGIRDEAEIRGHRRTYVGALPGRIIQGIKTAGSNNPVFMLDEIDKVGNDFRGDPSAALLEALDPEQNHEFSDHYLEVPFDLSKVMFVTTANVLDTIPPALRDRLEIIRFAGYTADEKEIIAKKYLISKTVEANGLSGKKVRRPLKEKRDEAGMATGLAWTQSGGDVLFIEAAVIPGKGRIILTGQLGEVMKESAQAAISYARSRWQGLKLKRDFYQSIDLHVHVPEGAVPKTVPRPASPWRPR